MTTPPPDRGWRGTPDLWLDAAHALLLEAGVDAVKVAPLAQRLGLSRTSFYHHFPDREALLAALIARWEAKNTANLLARCAAYAETLAEAMLNVFDCWIDPALFDSAMEFALRNWALTAPDLAQKLAETDAVRLAALTALFRRFGRDATEADTRARVVYLTQIGYISLRSTEPLALRLARIPTYVEAFTGTPPTPAEIARFTARHMP
ncbi:transcriptional regulator, TetR family [Gemmobacter aquatilis]|uniref:Transcriptional regulator, TetR family n=1 Tax=Gemmobacter aquatilis TaxID=933059 RepID=A0A1H8JXZ2_9RHOB|nr:TetR/AcrR family transcriptional regulator [Gemmobacter aquatilis]SEN85078.1 transcriptional regulator, TetR family [Gemmobacter aquatilis]